MRLMRRAVTVSLALVVLLLALVLTLLSASVYTYHALTAETLIAELRFEPTGDGEYLAHLRTGDRCDERTFRIFGEQWRIDAAFLKWKYWATLLGLDSQYRLDRLEGRYRTAAAQNERRNVAHDLGPDTALDVVSLADSLGRFNFLIDATYGSSTYTDIDPSNVYYVFRTTTGIITRSMPLPPAPLRGEPLAIDVSRACGAPVPVWERVSSWIDARVEAVLGWLR